MEQKTDQLYSSASLEKHIDIEQRLERPNDVYSSKNSNNNFKELISYFKYRNHKSKKKYKKQKMITTIIKSFDTVGIFATTTNSFTLSLTGNGLKVIPK